MYKAVQKSCFKFTYLNLYTHIYMVEKLCSKFLLLGELSETLGKFVVEYEYIPHLLHKTYLFCFNTTPLVRHCK